MRIFKSTFVIAVALVLGASASLAADNTSTGHAGMDHSKMKGMDHSKMGDQGLNDDAKFLDQFSQHHSSAIKMAKMALEKAQNPEIKKMAQKTVKDQTKEIEQMQKWRDREYASVPKSDEKMPEMDMSRLETSTGNEFDVAFAEMMAKHHDDGIKMASAAAPSLDKKQVREFAEKSAKKQQVEKQKLTQIQSKIGAGSSSSATTQGDL